MFDRPRIFIGSSSESKHFAELVSNHFKDKYECVVWADSFFELNHFTYETLVQKAIAFDFAIYIGGKDDLVVRSKDGSEKFAPRDNIYLEFGLYAGILSPARSYFLLHEDCRIASDLLGLTVGYFHDDNSILEGCHQIHSKMQNESRKSRIQLLPSTSLAIGYYYNFLDVLGKTLFEMNRIKIKRQIYDISKMERSIQVLIPSKVDVDWSDWTREYVASNPLEHVFFFFLVGNLSVYVDIDALQKKKQLRILDIPQTLQTSFKAVKLVLGKNWIGEYDTEQIAKKREVDNFCNALHNLVSENAYINNLVKIVEVDV